MTVIPRTDLDIFPLNRGGNPFGWTSDREASFTVLDAFAAAGGNFIDTADAYATWGEGLSGGRGGVGVDAHGESSSFGRGWVEGVSREPARLRTPRR